MRIKRLKEYKKILIMGYGLEGRATEKFLKKYCPDTIIAISDQKDNPNYLKKQQEYNLVIKTPGISKRLITIAYTTATNIFFANINNLVVGVTGTKGKSTTASLIYSILKEAGKKVHLVGNIGKPALELLMNKINKEDIFVCELSSYQLDDIQFSPHISVVLDLYPEHMNYHQSVEAYYRAKKNIIKFVTKDDYFIFNPNFKKLVFWSQEVNCHSIPFENKINLKSNPLIGEHNIDNLKAAFTVGHLLKINDDIINQAIKKFKPLPHRLQLVGCYSGITFYDDAISTTPESTTFAIKSLKNISTILLGGQDRGYEFSNLTKTLIDYKILNLVLFPDSGNKIYRLLLNTGHRFNILKTSSMEEAVKFAYKVSPKKSICLLSTASPSYSVWKNFEEKGDLFQFYVKKYSQKK